MNNNVPILIVGRDPEPCRGLAEIISRNFDGVEFAADEERAIEIIDQIESLVLVVSCPDLSHAEHLQLSLLRRSTKLHALPYQTLLLCSKNEAKNAYEACVKQIFDNYAIDKPIYDVHRIYLTIHQARDIVAATIEARRLRQHIEQIRREFPDLDDVFTTLAEQVAGLKRHSERAYRELFVNVDKQVGHLGTALSSPDYRDVLTVVDEQALIRRLKKFAARQIKPHFEAAQAQVDGVLHGVVDEFHTEAEKSARAIKALREQSQDLVPTRIMLVDDDPVYRDVIKASLETAGFQVFTLASGTEALTKIVRLQPALVLIDYEMPEMNGIDTTHAIRAVPAMREMPIIMLTGKSTRELVQKAVLAGACDYIVKPADRATLLRKINTHIRTQER